MTSLPLNPSGKKLGLVISSLTLGLGLSGQAQAGSYAVSFANVTDLFVDATPAGSPGIIFVPGTDVPTSKTSAELDLVGESNGGANSADAPASNAPGGSVTRINNVFNAFATKGSTT